MTMRNWGFAAGLAAALALYGTATAQSPAGSQMGGTGQEQGASGRDAGSAGSTASGQATGQKVDKDLEEKLQKIHAANQAELQMAQLGTQQAQSPEVKQYAETLQKDHQDMDQQLTQAAQSAGVQLQGKAFDKKQKDAQKDMEKLQKKTGEDFDKEYMSHMVKDHEKDLKEVRSAAKDAEKANQTQLASVLDQAARGIEAHRDQAEQIRDALKGEKGQARTGAAAGSTGSAAEPDAGSTGAAETPGATPSGGAPGTSSDRPETPRGDTGRGQQAGEPSRSTGDTK
jgi:putative membrane protein